MPSREEVKPEISPCCKSEAILSARFMGKEAWRCTNCNKKNYYKLI